MIHDINPNLRDKYLFADEVKVLRKIKYNIRKKMFKPSRRYKLNRGIKNERRNDKRNTAR